MGSAFFIAFCVRAATNYPLINYYYPQAEGAEWQYTGTDWDGEPADTVWHVDDVAKKLTCYTGRSAPTSYIRTVSSFHNAYCDTVDLIPYDEWFEYSSTEAGVLTYWGMDDDPGAYEERLDRGYAFPATLAVGQKVTLTRDFYTNAIYAGPMVVSIQLIGVENVTVPVATFADCLHLRFSLGTEVHDEWWALGTGCVKQRGVSGEGAQKQRDLVSFDVGETGSVTVQKNGSGTISPDLNGKELVIGQSYLMTAQPAGTGVKFANWTDATDGSVVTNGATVLFTMSEGRALVANFTDVTRPTASITAPTKAQTVVGGTNALFTVRGTAADNGGVAAVMWQLDGGPFEQADTTNSWKNWSGSATLSTGTNTVRAYSVDLSGNVSITQSVVFTYAALGVPIVDFAKGSTNKAFGYKAVSGAWYYLDALLGLYCLSPAKGASSAMQVSMTGPGLLSFSWELSCGDGTNALTCVAGSKVLATNKVAGAALFSSVAVPAGAQTVKWTVTRGKVSGEVNGIIRDVRWTPLAKAELPTPGNSQVLMRRNLEGLCWNADCDTCRVYAGLSTSALKPVGTGVYDSKTVPVADINTLVEQAAGKTVYWRVDTILKDVNGNETVNTGPVWSFMALPEGSPEFESQAESGSLTVGVQYELGPFTVISSESGTLLCAVRAGALPTGMKTVVSNGAVYVTGVPSKPGTYQAAVQISKKTATATVPGTTMSFAFTVSALSAWAVGDFNGYVASDELGKGQMTMSVTALGKVTGKIAIAGSNFTFNASSYLPSESGDEWLVVTDAKAGNVSIPLTLTVWPPVGEEGISAFSTLGHANGTFGDSEGIALYRNIWKDAGMAAGVTNFTGYYTASLSGGEGFGSGYLAVTVDKAGGVKTAGKLADGTVVSLSGPLIMDDSGRLFAVLYTAPATYKGGSFFGVMQFVMARDFSSVVVRPLDAESLPFLWASFNPTATAEYGAGFWREPSLSGGWYNAVINLREYYAGGVVVGGVGTLPSLLATVKYTDYDPESELETPPKISWTETLAVGDAGVSPNGLLLSVTPATGIGTGLSAPMAQTPAKVADPDTGEFVGYNYADLENPTGLKFGFTRTTGLFKGTFNAYYDYASAIDNTTSKQTWTHTVKTATYEGVLTPVREDMADGVAGRGFFLWADKGSYDSGKVDTADNPIMTAFTFSWSYDFLLSLP